MSLIKLYGHPFSGHTHRVALFLSIIELGYDNMFADLAGEERRQTPFMALNPAGQIPVLVDGQTIIPDSNSILIYLAQTYAKHQDWLPKHPQQFASVNRYLSLASGSLADGSTTVPLFTLFNAPHGAIETNGTSHDYLAFIDSQLENNDWLVASRPTLADITQYSNIVHTSEGKADLSAYSNIKHWLHNVESLRGFIPVQDSAVGLAA
ncbi:glutathione S-transferase family protein [Neptunicella marina]|uniref:Glutathione S-transferase family protein n=1 Tax=Neptunicella marina TaxID=2125989 RepID=A0A8J6IXR2_9ALTE|nr:glutathione S-transferase family protein [Neptunicella marina]MBC3767306.1 glutathione S-transferase family protein [Neptunicella marina]